MSDTGFLSPWRRFLARPNTDRTKTMGMALIVALVCGLSVSSVAVLLRPLQLANVEAQRSASMLAMLEGVPGVGSILQEAEVEVVVVDLDAGTLAADIDPATFDQQAAASDPQASIQLSRGEDLAGIGRRENHALVHLLRDGEGNLALAVLPVRGTGYQSTIRAYLALEPDLDTIAAFAVYEQGETPGVGARITEAPWQAQFSGTRIRDEDGDILFDVVPGASGPYEVDAISGATVTGYAISDMVHFWMGERGFGPFLETLRAEEAP